MGSFAWFKEVYAFKTEREFGIFKDEASVAKYGARYKHLMESFAHYNAAVDFCLEWMSEDEIRGYGIKGRRVQLNKVYRI